MLDQPAPTRRPSRAIDRLLRGFCVVLALVLTPSAAGADENAATAVRAVLAAMENAWNAGDMDGYLDAYASRGSMSLAFGNQSVGSRAELDSLFRQAYPDPERMGRFTIDTFTVDFLRPDIAVAHGRFTHYFPHEIVHGGYSHVLSREDDGRWVIRHERTSRGRTETLE